MTDGWIKLYRSVMDANSTFNRLTPIQRIIAIYILLNANYKDGIWYDNYKNIEVAVKRGQLVTSRNKIKEWFNNDSEVTNQKIRTVLKKLESLNFLTIETTNNYTLITVVNYEVYQANEQEDNQGNNQEVTKKQPRGNQEVTNGITTNKNIKKDKNINNIYIVFEHYKKTFEGFYKKITLTKKRESHINARLNEGYTVEQINQAISNIRTSSYHTGENDKGMFYATLEFICRSPENLEKWINHIPKKVADKKPEGKGFDNFKKREYDPEELKQRLLRKSRGGG